MSSFANNTPYLTMSKGGSWNLKPSRSQTRRVAQLRRICKQTIIWIIQSTRKKEASTHEWRKNITIFLWCHGSCEANVYDRPPWMDYISIVFKEYLISLKTIGSLSWKMMIAPSLHKNYLQGQILHRHNSWPFGSNRGLNMGD
jgi:hypothetical protein